MTESVRKSGEFALLAADGHCVEVNLSITPLPAADESAWSIVATDISERVRATRCFARRRSTRGA